MENQVATHLPCTLTGQGQPQTQTLDSFSVGLGATNKSSKDSLVLFKPNARPFVRDHKDRVIATGLAPHLDLLGRCP